MNPLDALQIANPIMNALLQMLSFGDNVTGGVQEDALMAIGTLVEGMRLLNVYYHYHCYQTEWLHG